MAGCATSASKEHGSSTTGNGAGGSVAASTTTAASSSASSSTGTGGAPPVQCDASGLVRSIGSAGDDIISDAAYDPAGNLIVTGGFNATASFAPNVVRTPSGKWNGFVAKYAPTGALLFLDTFGQAGDTEVDRLATSPDGSIVVIGSYSAPLDLGLGALPPDGTTFILKLSGDGKPIWNRALGPAIDWFGARTIAVDALGRIDIGGRVNLGSGWSADLGCGAIYSGPPADGSTAAWVARLDPGGACQWMHTYVAGAVAGSVRLAVTALDANAAGEVAVGVSAVDSSTHSVDFNGGLETIGGVDPGFVVTLGADGSFKRSHKFAPAANGLSGMVIDAVAIDSAANVAVLGNIASPIDLGTGVVTPVAFSDLFVSVIDASNHPKFGRLVGSQGEDWGTSIAFRPSGGVLFGGLHSGSMKLGSIDLPHSAEGFVAELDASGAPVAAFGFGDGSGAFPIVRIDPCGRVLAAGEFQNTLTSPSGSSAVSNGGINGFFTVLP